MTPAVRPAPRGSGRAPDHSGIRLPVIPRRFVPAGSPRRTPGSLLSSHDRIRRGAPATG
jgi:hypothetical protein